MKALTFSMRYIEMATKIAFRGKSEKIVPLFISATILKML